MMRMNSNRDTLAHDTAARSGRKVYECRLVIDEFFNVVTTAAALGREVQIREAFTFYPRTRKARWGARNPRTGEPVMLPERRTLLARFAKGYLA